MRLTVLGGPGPGQIGRVVRRAQLTAALVDRRLLQASAREKVLIEWRIRFGGGRGHGVVALSASDSGTGKTMSAEVIAEELDLYLL